MRNQKSTVQKYKIGILRDGIQKGVRSEIVVIPAPSCADQVPFLAHSGPLVPLTMEFECIAGGHLRDAAYQAYKENPRNTQVRFSIEAGVA
eukprot:7644429-Pyramimonas_sp.AAC.1